MLHKGDGEIWGPSRERYGDQIQTKLQNNFDSVELMHLLTVCFSLISNALPKEKGQGGS